MKWKRMCRLPILFKRPTFFVPPTCAFLFFWLTQNHISSLFYLHFYSESACRSNDVERKNSVPRSLSMACDKLSLLCWLFFSAFFFVCFFTMSRSTFLYSPLCKFHRWKNPRITKSHAPMIHKKEREKKEDIYRNLKKLTSQWYSQ